MKNCIKVRRTLPGLMGLLSFLGLIGIFTEERSFLAFFCFAMDFSYFFLKRTRCRRHTWTAPLPTLFTAA